MRLLAVVAALSVATFTAGCSGSDGSEQHSTTTRSEAPSQVTPKANPIPGFTGGCKGFEVWTQKQFQAPDSGFGAKVRPSLDAAALPEGIPGNVMFVTAGWYEFDKPVVQDYADNPAGIQTKVWYYIPDANDGRGGWIADAGLRSHETKPAPDNESKYFDLKRDGVDYLAHPECELTRR